MKVMAIGTRVQDKSTGEFGTILRAKKPIWNGEKIEVEYLITWDLDDEADEPGWNWDQELTPIS